MSLSARYSFGSVLAILALVALCEVSFVSAVTNVTVTGYSDTACGTNALYTRVLSNSSSCQSVTYSIFTYSSNVSCTSEGHPKGFFCSGAGCSTSSCTLVNGMNTTWNHTFCLPYSGGSVGFNCTTTDTISPSGTTTPSLNPIAPTAPSTTPSNPSPSSSPNIPESPEAPETEYVPWIHTLSLLNPTPRESKHARDQTPSSTPPIFFFFFHSDFVISRLYASIVTLSPPSSSIHLLTPIFILFLCSKIPRR